MTKEEKALAYDEALRKIRPLYGRAKKEDCPIWSTYEYIFPELHESEDERIRRTLVEYFGRYNPENKWDDEFSFKEVLAYLEKQKDASKAIEAVDRIYKYTEVENVANAHDMNDSNPNKKYYCGWNDALGKIAGILQDVYSEKENKFTPRVLPCSAAWFEDGDEKQKEQRPTAKINGEPISTENQTVKVGDDETEAQKSYREGKNAGRQEVFDYPGAYGLERIDNVFGFRIGDKVRLKDGDGRPHIIKYFEKIEGLHGPDFYRVVFEDNTASDHIIPGDEFLNGYYTQMEKIDEQGEQKPAEWSEGDETCLQDVLWCIEKAEEVAKDENYMGICWCARRWLKSLPERFNLQSKQEWSEEEMKVLDSIIDDYEKAAKSFCGYDGKIGLLKAIRDGEYNLPKPAELSEEDETCLTNILIMLKEYAIHHYSKDDVNKSVDWLENKFKSLRPHWKPSEE